MSDENSNGEPKLSFFLQTKTAKLLLRTSLNAILTHHHNIIVKIEISLMGISTFEKAAQNRLLYLSQDKQMRRASNSYPLPEIKAADVEILGFYPFLIFYQNVIYVAMRDCDAAYNSRRRPVFEIVFEKSSILGYPQGLCRRITFYRKSEVAGI